MTQRKYVLDLLEETGKLGIAPFSVTVVYNSIIKIDDRTTYNELPEEVRKKVNSKKIKPFQFPKRYHRLIIKLNYLLLTRPNVTYLISVLSQSMEVPTIISNRKLKLFLFLWLT